MKLTQRIRDGIRMSAMLGGIAAIGLLATACGTSANSTTTRQIQVRVWRVNQDVDVIRDSVSDVLGANANYKFAYTKKDSLDGYELSALKSLTARKGPDVWSIPSDWLGDHFSRLTALPDNFFASDTNATPDKPADFVKTIYPSGISSQITNPVDQKVYGLPTGVDYLQLYVNTDLMNTALQEYIASLGDNADDSKVQPVEALMKAPPATWSDLVDQTRYITKRNGATITRSAIAMGTADNVNNSADILQLLMLQNGAKITSDDHKSALFHIPITTATGIQARPGENALSFYSSFADPSKPNYTWNPSLPQVLDAFGQGKVAMVIAYTDFGKQLKIKYPNLSYDLAPVPQISNAPLQTPVNLIQFWVETVPSVADSQTAALNVMKAYALNPDSIAQEAGLGSPLLQTLQGDKDNFPNKQILTGRSVFKKNRTEFDADFRQMIIDVSQNGLTPAQSLASGADKINGLLSQPDE